MDCSICPTPSSAPGLLNLCFLLWALAESVILGQQTSSGWAHFATGPQQLLLGTLPGPAARKRLEGELLALR